MGSEEELKHAAAMVRPISVAFEAVISFHFYKGGVYTSDTYGSTPMDVNHAVLAIGYGVENDVPYWLIKNSWGAEWGDNGYFKMEIKKTCVVSQHVHHTLLLLDLIEKLSGLGRCLVLYKPSTWSTNVVVLDLKREGPFEVSTDGSIKFEEEDGIDYDALIFQFPNGERVSFPFHHHAISGIRQT